MQRGILLTVIVMATVTGGPARADHTKEDARATSAKLEAILHPPKARLKREAKAKPAPSAETTTTAARVSVERSDGDPLWALLVHALSIPFEASEREANLRDIPKSGAELEAHLRNLPTTPAEIEAHLRNLPTTPAEVEAHLRNLPKSPAEVGAHLRRLDAALDAKHTHR
jgi:septal ring factor EnvC (AmiA/AmiB activator)